MVIRSILVVNYSTLCNMVNQETELLDYEVIREIALKVRPKLIISGAIAYPRQINFQAFQQIAEEVSAISMADIAHIAGLIVGGVHSSPFPLIDVVTTTTHKILRGPRGAMIMCKEKFAKEIDRAVLPEMQGGPHDYVTSAMAMAFGEDLKPEFKEYAPPDCEKCPNSSRNIDRKWLPIGHRRN